ncbi:MAG TPA: hypothetical protein RMF84_14035 [Polyangiaceae bacterium LLY-WYZ-14_1]|nr:hypothetical protein [Polyangiaceae bacterium LLY-WYZ-14_1]
MRADMDDDGSDEDNAPDGPTSWVDRHLGKILLGALVFCALALLGRALTG